MIRKIIGWLMLLSVFGGLYVVLGTSMGFFIASFIFAVSIVLTLLIVLGSYLII
jgi:hypothetical protein